MNPDSFFENFSLLAETPNGIQKLREMILQMAVQGKLVPQNPDDEPAEVLLGKIKEEKERLVKEGKIRKHKKLPLIDESEISFEIPDSWVWIRLNEVYDVRDGTHDSPKYQKEGYPLVTSKNISSGKLDLSNVKYISEKDYLKISERSQVEKNDILFAMIGSIGNPVIVNVEPEFSIKNVALFKYYTQECSNPRYLHYFLIYAANIMRERAAGGVQSFVSLGFLRSYLIPLPPIAEQKRIVTKVDQLMELCDQFESLHQKKHESRINLNNAALNKMLDAGSPEDFAENWRLVCDNFGLLYDNLENVEKLRQAILQLAVMGKLVEQNDEDEPALTVISNIIDKRNQWYEKESVLASSEGRRKPKKPKLKRTVNPKNLVFPSLPDSWDICFFEDIAANKENAIKAGPFGSALTKNCYVASGYKIYGQEQVIKENASFGDYYIDDEKYSKLKSCEVASGDILISLVGTIGKVLILPENCEPGIINPRLIKLSLDASISKEYIKLYLYSPLAKGILADESHGGTMDILNLRILKKLPIPLPPLAEQKRIVAKVDQLMELCDRLESDIRQAQEDGERLMEAAVSNLLSS